MKKEINLKLRMVLVALAGAVPLALVALCLIYLSVNRTIEFGRQELHGSAFQRPLEKILELLPQVQAARNVASANTATLVEEMDRALQSLTDNYNGDLGSKLKFTDSELSARKRENARLSVVQSNWQRWKTTPPGAVADELNAQLTGSIRMMIAHAGDLSNLILDSDLDSYYLMDITLCALPQTQQRLGDNVAQISGWLRGTPTTANRMQAAVLAAMLQADDVDRITGDAQTSLSEDKNFYGASASLQANLPGAVEKYTQANAAFIALLNRVAAGENVSAAELETTGWLARSESFRLWDTAVNELDELLRVRVASFRRLQWMNLGIVALTLMLASVVIWWNVRTLAEKFDGLINSLTENSNMFVSAASQISESSRGLAEGSSEQAASIEQTSASLEELAAMTKRNSENTEKANALSKETCTAADRGVQDMKAMSAAMSAIKISSDEIAKIIRTIDEIAFQTNILALNAAVEAARAGEAGMGFAVVADEVRTLAQRSAAAAKETAAKIDSALANTEQGVALTGQVASALDSIAAKARQLDDLATEVATASREQSQGISSISTAAGQMDKVTQGNAATAEECSAAAMELNSQAQAMKRVVNDLIGVVNGAAAQSTAQKNSQPALQLTAVKRNVSPSARREIPLEDTFRDF
jgi:methyl-accepting chemotaxis protein